MLTAVAIAIGCVLDLLIGDPHSLPHPIRLIGRLIGSLEMMLRKRCDGSADELRAGRVPVSYTHLTLPTILLV